MCRETEKRKGAGRTCRADEHLCRDTLNSGGKVQKPAGDIKAKDIAELDLGLLKIEDELENFRRDIEKSHAKKLRGEP